VRVENDLKCPNCRGIYFKVRREVTYLYTYKLDTPLTAGRPTDKEGLPFLFDDREQINNNEYLQCESCNSRYPCDLEELKNKIDFTIVRKAIRADHVNNPEFLG
jgi:DNA-directed RNA polymerase subunit RPC12/RpoP